MNRSRRWLAVLTLLLCASAPASAQSTYTWNGGVAGGWADGGGGWLDGAGPANWSNATSLVAVFGGALPPVVTIDAAGVMAYGLNFTGGSYVVTGGVLTLGDPSAVGGTAGIISVSAGFSPSISSIIAGSVGLIKTGDGTLMLGGVNTYTGTSGTTVNGGTLQLNAGATLGANNNRLFVNNGATLNLGGNSLVIGQTNDGGGAGAVGTITNGTLNLNGNNFFFESGTMNADLTGSGGSRVWLGGDAAATILLGGSNTVDFGDHHSTIIGHPVTGAVGIVQLTSSGALGPNDVAGNIIEAQLFTGTIDFNGQVGVAVGNLLLASGGASKLLNTASTPASSTGSTQVNQNGTEIGGSGNITLGGLVTGSGGFNKVGAGTLILPSANTYNGITIFSEGIVNAATFSDYGVPGSLGNRGGDTGGDDMGLLFRGGTLQYTGNTPQSTNRMIRVSTTGGGGTIDASGVGDGATLSFTAVSTLNFWETGGNRTLTLTGTNTGTNTFATAIPDIPGVTTSGVTKAGSGTWYLTNSGSNYRGTTTFAGGILNVASLSDYDVPGSLGSRPSGVDSGNNIGLLFRGGVLQYTGATPQSTNRTIRVSTDGGGGTIDASGSVPTATLTFNATTTPNFWENPGPRTLTLTGTNPGANTIAFPIPDITGVTTSSVTKAGAGTWVLSGANTYRGPTNVNNGILRITNSASLGIGGFDGTTLTNVNGGTLEIDGSLTIDEHFHFRGAGFGGLGAVRAVSGSTVLSTSSALDDDGTNAVVFNALAGTSVMLGGVIYNDTGVNAGLTKIGQGDVILSAANTYNTRTTVDGGTLRLAGAGTLGAANTPVAVNTGATLDLGGTTQTIGQMNFPTAGAVGTITNGSINLNGNNFYFKSGTLDANLTGVGESRLWIGGDTGATVLLGGINTIDYSDHHSTIIGFAVTGEAGTVRLTSPTGLGPTTIGANVIEAQLFGGTIDANGQAGITIGNLLLASGPASQLVNSNTLATASFLGTIQVNAANTPIGGNGNITFQNAVNGGGGLTKVGPGTVVFSAPATYSGTTTINAGTLRSGATNTLPPGTMALAGGTLSSGDTVGFSNTLGTLQVTTGSIDLGTGLHTLNFAAFNSSTFTSMTVFGWTGVGGAPGLEGKLVFTDLTGFTPGVLNGINFDGYNPGAMLIGNELVPVPIPEPAMLLLAIAALPLLRRRQ